jgi:ADP-heptose:LPS heptosyltransferase
MERMQVPAVNLAGQTTLGELAALVKGACLVVCNDTGVSHMAAALRVPSIVLFSASEPERWAPANRELHRSVLGASQAAPQTVLALAEGQLAKDRAYAND